MCCLGLLWCLSNSSCRESAALRGAKKSTSGDRSSEMEKRATAKPEVHCPAKEEWAGLVGGFIIPR